jgi:5-methylcytosine-specific restriction protein A
MPSKPPRVCAQCGNAYSGPHCACRAQQRRASDHARGTAAQRGYGHHWAANRRAFLAAHPLCALCGRLADVADHHPHTRRQLLAWRVPDPDAWHRLRPLCTPCHNRHTARTTPGGWNANHNR